MRSRHSGRVRVESPCRLAAGGSARPRAVRRARVRLPLIHRLYLTHRHLQPLGVWGLSLWPWTRDRNSPTCPPEEQRVIPYRDARIRTRTRTYVDLG